MLARRRCGVGIGGRHDGGGGKYGVRSGVRRKRRRRRPATLETCIQASVDTGQPNAPALPFRERLLLAAVELFLGVGALYGGIELLTDAVGFGLKEAWLDGTPFPDYMIPALFLLVVIGGGMLAAAAIALAGSKRAAAAALGMGVVVLAFLVIETVSIGYHGATQLPLLVTTAVAAAALVIFGARAIRR